MKKYIHFNVKATELSDHLVPYRPNTLLSYIHLCAADEEDYVLSICFWKHTIYCHSEKPKSSCESRLLA